jgi:hypothetical protein
VSRWATGHGVATATRTHATNVPTPRLPRARRNTNEYDNCTIHWAVQDGGLTVERMAARALRSGSGYDYSLALHVGDIR